MFSSLEETIHKKAVLKEALGSGRVACLGRLGGDCWRVLSQPFPPQSLFREAVVLAPCRAYMLQSSSKCPITVNGLLFLN